MPRKKQKDPALADLEATPLEAKPKRKRTPKEPASLAEPLQELVEQIPGLTTGDRLTGEPERPVSHAADTLPTPHAELPPPTTEVVAAPERESVRAHVERVIKDRPVFAPVPRDFRSIAGWRPQGIKVNWSMDKKTAALQFADTMPLSRATEYPLMRKLQEVGFVYRVERKQWERYDAEQPGTNIIDAKELAEVIAKDRSGRLR